MKIRLHNLDYLRGLAAFSIMIYHFCSFSFGEPEPGTFLSKIGLYGVSIFYVLSGLTLYLVYFKKMKPDTEDLKAFFKKRIYRIFPLLWLVTFAHIVLSKQVPDFGRLVLNLTGLFGLVQPTAYFATGAWSIGNELVFYAFFPFFIWFTKWRPGVMVVLSVLITALYLFFAFYFLSGNQSLQDQWDIYINPLNQVFLFLCGFLIGHLWPRVNNAGSIMVVIVILGVTLFVLWPVDGNRINAVIGSNRIIFTLCCAMVCAGFFRLSISPPNIIHKPLSLGSSCK